MSPCVPTTLACIAVCVHWVADAAATSRHLYCPPLHICVCDRVCSNIRGRLRTADYGAELKSPCVHSIGGYMSCTSCAPRRDESVTCVQCSTTSGHPAQRWVLRIHRHQPRSHLSAPPTRTRAECCERLRLPCGA